MDITKFTRPARKLLPLKLCGAVIVAAGSASRMGGIDKVMAPLGGEPMIARTVRAFQNCDAIAKIVIVTRIVAAGSASRMGGIDKVMAPLGGEPMIARTVRAFQNCDAIAKIVIVTRQDLILPITQLTHDMDKVIAVVCGGSSRQESVQLGLNALPEEIQLAAIHDGARPLVGWQLIDRVVRAANTYNAAAPAIPVKDTIKVVKGRVVDHTPDRAALFAVQNPQVFDFDLLRWCGQPIPTTPLRRPFR